MKILSHIEVVRLLAEFAGLSALVESRNYLGAVEALREAFNTLMNQERFADALALHEALLQVLPDSLDASELRLWCLLGVGNAEFHLDHDAAAEEAYKEMRAGALESGDDFLHSEAMARLGDLARKRGLRPQAEQFYRDSLKIKVQAKDFFGAVAVFLWLAALAEEGGERAQATSTLTAAENILGILRRASGADDSKDSRGRQDVHYWEMALWFQQASLRRAEGDLAGAQRIYRKALRVARSRQDATAESKLLLNLANNLVEQGSARKALPLYQDSLRVAQQSDLGETSRQAHQGLAVAFFRLKRFAESLPHYEAAREAVRLDDLGFWASLTADTGAVCIEAGDFDRGTALLDEALAHFRTTADTAWQERILRNYLLADARLGYREQFLTHLRECLNLFPQDAFLARRSVYHQVGTLCLNAFRDARSAARYFRQAVAESCAAGDLPAAGHAAALAGASLLQEGASGEALALFDRAAEIFTAMGDEANLWLIHNDRGLALSNRGEYEEAEAEFSWCFQAAVERHNRPLEAQAQLNLGEIERLEGEVEKAVAHERQALALYQQMEDEQGELDALNALGLCLLEELRQGGEDRAEEAYPHFERALQLAKRLKIRSKQAMATRGLARVAERRGQVTAALRLYHKAADLWERERDYGHATEALAARVTLQIVRLKPERWHKDTERLMQTAIKGGAVGKAAHGIVGAAGHLVEMRALETAAEFVRLALMLHRYQAALSPPTRDSEAEAAQAGEDFYRTIFFVVSIMEHSMTSVEQTEFLDRITQPDNFEDPVDGGVLRETIEQVRYEFRDELKSEGNYEQS